MVLTDINMPLVSGLELFLFLHRERPIVPVFIMTGDDRLISRFKKINLGAADYFLKPCTGINLVEKISEKLLRD